MIELLWKDSKPSYYQIMKEVADLFLWFSNTLLEEWKNKKSAPFIQGYMVLWDVAKDTPAVLIYSNSEDKKNQEEILHILQQPPGEFEGKYVPCILSQEPEGVIERTTSELEIEVEEEDEEKGET